MLSCWRARRVFLCCAIYTFAVAKLPFNNFLYYLCMYTYIYIFKYIMIVVHTLHTTIRHILVTSTETKPRYFWCSIAPAIPYSILRTVCIFYKFTIHIGICALSETRVDEFLTTYFLFYIICFFFLKTFTKFHELKIRTIFIL